MTQPALAVAVRRLGRQYPYPPQDLSHLPRNQWNSIDQDAIPDGVQMLPSITTCLKVIDKPGLLVWAGEQAIRELYDSGALPLDPDVAAERHKGAHQRRAKERADVGTQAHTVAQALTEDLPLPGHLSEEDESYMDAFLAFWKDQQPEPLLTETTVYGDGYAGTTDAVLGIGSKHVVVDYKTRRERDDGKIAKFGALYDENRMQLAAVWAAAEFAAPHADGWELEPWMTPDAVAGVVLFPDGSYVMEPVEGLDRWYRAFIAARDLWQATKGDG